MVLDPTIKNFQAAGLDRLLLNDTACGIVSGVLCYDCNVCFTVAMSYWEAVINYL